MAYLGDFRLGDTFDTKFTTVATTGAPTTLAGTPVISAYVGNSVTESTTGITLSVDFDGRTGMHNVRVVATSGNGYATASDYQLVITTGTVGGTSVVGYVIGEFSIEHRSALMPTTAARTLDISAGGEAGLDWANIGSKTTVNDLSSTTISTSQAVASVSGAVGSVTGLTASNLDTTVSSRLAPTTAGRTLDVTATGAAGIDWGNLENPTTVVGLSSTTISTSQAIASVSGAVGSVTSNVGGNVVGSVGSVVGAVGSVTGAVGSVTGNVGGNVTGSVGSVVGLTASNLDATITSRLAAASYTAPDNTGIATIEGAVTDPMTESYAALGAEASLAQILYEIRAILAENSVASTTVTVKKLDGSTTAATYTINNATTPTAITRAS
jgi:hypothetical protein